MIELIPAIDLIDGLCVRLTKGDYSTQKTYIKDPLDAAKAFEDMGMERLHMVDLDGARSHHIVNHRVLERIATHTHLTVDFGGGIKTDEDLQVAFDSGAAMVTIGSIAVTDPQRFTTWLQQFGAERIILGADVKNGRISINGWKEEGQDLLLPFLQQKISQGITKVLCTDISKDGMLQGPAIDLYKEIMSTHPTCHLIASGGVSSIDDIRALDEAGIPAVVFGKAYYEGRITPAELEKFRVQS